MLELEAKINNMDGVTMAFRHRMRSDVDWNKVEEIFSEHLFEGEEENIELETLLNVARVG